MSQDRYRRILFIMVAVAISIRFINITMPILEGTAARQVETAMMARNFFKYGFDILYPQVDFMGRGPGYLVLEFPILPALAAAGYKIAGGSQEWIGRFFVILFFGGSLIFLSALSRRLFGGKVALWAVIVYAFSPLSIIYSRTFMPDFIMLFFSLGSIYFMYIYSKEDMPVAFWLSAVFSSCALLAKPQSFYIAVPLIYLLWQREGTKFVASVRNLLYLLVAAVPAFLWYRHAGSVMRSSLTEAYNYEFLHWFRPGLFFGKELYIDLIRIYGTIFLTPIGFILFIAGLFLKADKESRFLWAWLFGVLLFMMIFVSHIDDPYYNLNMLPVASIFIARMLIFLGGLKQKGRMRLVPGPAKFIMVLVTFFFVAGYGLYHAYIVPKGYRYIPEAGAGIKKIAAEDDLIAVSAAGGSQGLYFCDRKGWSFHLPEGDYKTPRGAIERIELLRSKGARFFAAAVMEDFNGSPVFKEYMFKNYKLVGGGDGRYIIFSLE